MQSADLGLRAYEISTIHKREPPPKEILEDITAKGGDLLNRTVENFYRGSREAERLRTGDSDDSDEDADVKKTPNADRMDVDEPGSTGRATRSLRHAPPQRVLFQPESSARQTRQSAGHLNSPGLNGYGTSAAAVAIANYEPRTNIPLALKQ